MASPRRRRYLQTLRLEEKRHRDDLEKFIEDKEKEHPGFKEEIEHILEKKKEKESPEPEETVEEGHLETKKDTSKKIKKKVVKHIYETTVTKKQEEEL